MVMMAGDDGDDGECLGRCSHMETWITTMDGKAGVFQALFCDGRSRLMGIGHVAVDLSDSPIGYEIKGRWRWWEARYQWQLAVCE